MFAAIRKNSTTIFIAIVVSALLASLPAVAAVINATKLNGYRANQLVRVSKSSIVNNALVGSDGSNQIVIQTSIKAPKKGFLVIVASSDVFGGPDTDTCYLRLDGVQLTASNRSFTLSAGNDEEDCNTDSTWPVGPGKHTVALVASNAATGMRYDEATIQVIYIPFGKGGGVPNPIPPTAPVKVSGNN